MADFALRAAEVLVYLMLAVPFGLVLLPWWARKRDGSRGIWIYGALAILVLCFVMPVLFLVTCAVAECGQGVLVIVPLAAAWIVAGIFTLISAIVARLTLPKPIDSMSASAERR